MASGGGESDKMAREDMLQERYKYENRAINDGMPIHGAQFSTVGQTEINGELLTMYEWHLWVFKYKLEMILTKEYPEKPPLLRIFHDSGTRVQRPDIDENGFWQFNFGTDVVWKKENTLRWLCAVIMDHLRATTVQTYEPSTAYMIHGNFRHEMKITRDEYQYFVSTFGLEYLKMLRGKYTVRFEAMGGKVRARTGNYTLMFKSDSEVDVRDGMFTRLEAEIREHLSKELQTRARQNFQPRRAQPCQSRSQSATSQSATSQNGDHKERAVLESMGGVGKAGCNDAKPNQAIGRGRGRGRGRGQPRTIPVTDSRPVGIATNFARGKSIIGNWTASAAPASAIASARSQTDEEEKKELLTRLICQFCKKDEKSRLLIDCHHAFCQDCTRKMQINGCCGQCHHRIERDPWVLYF